MVATHCLVPERNINFPSHSFLKDNLLVRPCNSPSSEFHAVLYCGIFQCLFAPGLSNKGEMKIIMLMSIRMMIETVSHNTKVIVNIDIFTHLWTNSGGLPIAVSIWPSEGFKGCIFLVPSLHLTTLFFWGGGGIV